MQQPINENHSCRENESEVGEFGVFESTMGVGAPSIDLFLRQVFDNMNTEFEIDTNNNVNCELKKSCPSQEDVEIEINEITEKPNPSHRSSCHRLAYINYYKAMK